MADSGDNVVEGTTAAPVADANEEKIEKTPIDLTAVLEDMMAADKLGTDMELQKLMDAQMFIRFEKLKDKFPDHTIEDLQEAVEKSTTLVMNTDKSAVKPNLKPKRTVVIIREVPEKVEATEIREFISSCSTRPDIGSRLKDLHVDENAHVWFVNFEEEDDARECALWLQQQDSPWGEGKIRCAMKSDHLVRSFFPAPVAAPMPMDFAHPMFMGTGFMPFFMPPMKGKGKMMKGGFPKGKGKGGGKGKVGKGVQGVGPPIAASAPSSIEQVDLGLSPVDDDDQAGLYEGSFCKYTREEILSVCDQMKESLKKPESFTVFQQEHENVKGVFVVEPNATWAKTCESGVEPEPAKERRKKKKNLPEDQGAQKTSPRTPSRTPPPTPPQPPSDFQSPNTQKAAKAPKAKAKEGGTKGGGGKNDWSQNWGEGNQWDEDRQQNEQALRKKKKNGQPNGHQNGQQWVAKKTEEPL